MLITVDLGSFNIKTSTGFITENRFVRDNESESYGAEVLNFNDNNYFFGKGEFDKTFSKAHKQIMPPLLYSLSKSKVQGDTNLILHLPSSQMAMKKSIIEQLQGKEFSYSVNGIKNKVKFNKVAVLKEGWSSFYALAKRNEGLIAIMDIGGRTTDIFTFNNGIQEKEKSLPIGTMNLFSDIAETLNGIGQNRKLEDIHKLLVNKIIDIETFEKIIAGYAAKIVNNIKVDIEHLQDYKIFLTGGGAEYFKKELEKYFKIETMKESLISNCNGSLNIGKAKGF